MNHLLTGHDQTIAEWIGGKIGKPITGPFTALGWVSDEGRLTGGAVFNGWNGSNINVTIYGPGAFTRDALRMGFRYAFWQLHAHRLTAITERQNHRMLKILPRLGFRHEAVLKHWFGPYRKNDGVMFRIDAPTAMKWMK